MKSFRKMSDRRASLYGASLVLAVVLLVFLPIVLFSIHQVVSQGETRYTQLEVIRSENIIQHELTQLDVLMQSYSIWDDTYQFVQDKNQAYIDKNMADSFFVGSNLDVVIALSTSNQVVYSKYYDSSLQAQAPLPFEVDKFLQAYPSILKFKDIHTGHLGIAFLAGKPIFINARPVVTSMETGPARGVLIFGRFLDAGELANISQLGQRNINIFSTDHLPAGIPVLPTPSTSKDQVFVQPRDSAITIGYAYLSDLNDQPTLILQVENPRDLYAQARTTALVFSIALLLLGLGLFIGTFYFYRSLLKSRQASKRYMESFQAVVDQSRDAMLLINYKFQILQVNSAGRQLLGLPAGQTQASLLKSILSFEPDLDESLLNQLCQSGSYTEHHCVRRDGSIMDIELSASLIVDPAYTAYSLVLHDITARKSAETALRISEERYMLAANGSNDALWDWNLATDEIYYSLRWKTMLGYQEDEIQAVPQEWFDRVHPEDIIHLQTQFSDHLRNRTEHFECEFRIAHKDGQYRWMLARGIAVWEPAGYAHRIAGSQTDITDRKNIEEQLRYDALHDGLTGMGNRTLLIDHLNHVNERKRRKPDLLFALFFLDLDRFKQVNDSLGHQAGDQLLIEAAKRLERGLRSVDTVSRFSGPETLVRIAGDEFVILLEDFQAIEDIQKVAGRIIRQLGAPYAIAGKEVSLSASIGLVIPAAPYERAEDIIRDADIAMYQAKQLGGAQVVLFNQEMYQDAIARMELEREIHRGVERHEFEVYYQPIYILDNNQIAGFEALVRWNHPERGLLLPAEFIQVAEETGLIVPIGYFVLEEACQKMVQWARDFNIAPEVMVSVNFSARQISNANLVEKISSILSSTGLDPKKLWLEVTESMLVEQNVGMLDQLNQLRAMGIRIEIDDFGTGYSSLSYLKNLPVDGFKIDRSFVKDIHQEGGDQIVKTLVDLGHSLGLTQVAEGVETDGQKDYLKSLSCEYIQGFLMSRPVTAKAIEELIKNIQP